MSPESVVQILRSLAVLAAGLVIVLMGAILGVSLAPEPEPESDGAEIWLGEPMEICLHPDDGSAIRCLTAKPGVYWIEVKQ